MIDLSGQYIEGHIIDIQARDIFETSTHSLHSINKKDLK
jgi:hypothetical protein